jgi:catalase (peroxidase I)
MGPWVPPAQPFQNPLPPPPAKFPNWEQVREQLLPVIFPTKANPNTTLSPDVLPNGKLYNGAFFVQLAFQCAATYRQTDYLGGCNGARIRFPPESKWEVNEGLDQVLLLLQPVQKMFAPSLSWSDLIVFAAQIALEEAGSIPLKFCPGRTDATDGVGSDYLSPLLNGTASWDQMVIQRQLMGFSDREMVALSARLRSPKLQSALGYQGSWTLNPSILSNKYFVSLLNENWVQVSISSQVQYTNNASLFLVPSDLNLRWQPDPKALAQEFASDNDAFLSTFASAWTKLMNIDRYNGPIENLCS